MEPFTYFFGAIGIIASYIYPAISGRAMNPKKHFEQKKLDYFNKKHTEFNFNINRYEKLVKEKLLLEKEIKELKTVHYKKYSAFCK